MDEFSLPPPHDYEAEKATLGSLFIAPIMLAQIVELLTPDDFYYPQHTTIFSVILELKATSTPIDLRTVATRLEDLKELDNIGGGSYLAELACDVPTATHIVSYATTVKRKATLRRLLKAGAKFIKMAHDSVHEPTDILTAAGKELHTVVDHALKGTVREKTAVKDILDEVLEERENSQDKGIRTGIGLLDDNTKRLRGGHFWIVGGYTNVGKTGLMLTLVNSVCAAGKRALMLSLEMRNVDLVDRLLQYNEWKLRNHNEAIDKVATYDLTVMSTKRTLQDVLMTVETMNPKPHVVFIDFVQNLDAPGKSEYEKLTCIAQQLQALALRENICIVGLSQVTQEAAGVTDKVVISFKGSGALAAACDVGIELLRDADKIGDGEIVEMMMVIRKNRFGARARRVYDFDKSCGFIVFPS